ncbi:Flp pilus assembly protein CpaB [Thioalkalivibrio sp. ALJT]|uniref:Flp pilus assembly protein CpaB n=1 Tax=Thioalkalivibrio sp. ALJT TaxID=1158146 RepID=UPI0003620761|nr:Flp pilus assembly protein CpaB [Thioalkalivibrio sp. ALJT]
MSSRLLMGLAAVFFVAALVLGALGIHLSGTSDVADTEVEVRERVAPEPRDDAADPADQDRVDVVFASRDLAAGEIIRAEDLHVERLRAVPPQAFGDPEAVVGRMLESRVRAHEPLTAARFARASQLTRTLGPGERAVAISVNDETGVGGFLQPGDRVDVLLHLPSERRDAIDESAQYAHRNLRVLAYGRDLAVPADGVVDRDEEDDNGARRRGASTAVLAVPDAEATRLMLADHAGTLRLAARPAVERRPDFDPEAFAEHDEGERQEPLTLGVLRDPEDADTEGDADDEAEGRGLLSLDDLRPAPLREEVAAPDAPRPPPVFLHRGDSVEEIERSDQ